MRLAKCEERSVCFIPDEEEAADLAGILLDTIVDRVAHRMCAANAWALLCERLSRAGYEEVFVTRGIERKEGKPSVNPSDARYWPHVHPDPGGV